MKMHLVMAHAVNFIQTPGTLPCVILVLLAPDCMLCKHSTLLDVHQNMKRWYRSADNKLTQLLGSHKLNNTRIMCSLSPGIIVLYFYSFMFHFCEVITMH